MKRALWILFLASLGFAQAPAPSPPAASSAVTIPLTLPAPTMLPKLFVSGGGGFANPGGSFAYVSESTLVLPQQTYATVALEYTLVKGQVQSCTLAGLTKPMYQLSVITLGLTGLGGGCTGTNGKASAAGSGQPFFYVRWGKLPMGNVVTFIKNTDGTGWKVSLGFSWSKD